MRSIIRVIGVVFVISCALFSTTNTMAAANTKAPAAAVFYPLVGKWHGEGELGEAGQKPAALKLSLNCKKVSSGWGIACSMQAKNKSMTIMESDLMGVDPVTGQAHWYAVTSQGETHDHLATWSDASHMKAHYDWTQDGKKMQENISFTIKTKKSLTFHTVVTMEGKKIADFSGTLKR